MKYLLLCLALTGCASTGFRNTEVVVQSQYVVRTAPDTLKTLPPLPPSLPNPKTATNNQIAAWINNTEEYVANLEAMVQTLVNFYEKPVTQAEAGSLQPVTPLANRPTSRVIQPQTVAQPASSSSSFTTPLQRLRSQ